ncbi:hypothetical protein ACHWQZ_G017046 [Mnemiopsis leidyi]
MKLVINLWLANSVFIAVVARTDSIDEEVKNITTKQWCKHKEKFLSDKDSRNLKYTKLEEAKRQCSLRYDEGKRDEEEVKGVVVSECQDKDPSCPFSAAEGLCGLVFRYCRLSCNACPKDCGGITYEPDSDMYTLRRGSTLLEGSKSAVSWRKCSTVVRATRLPISRVEIFNKVDKPPSTTTKNVLPRFLDGILTTSSSIRFPTTNLTPLWIGMFLEKPSKVISVVIHGPEMTLEVFLSKE